MHTIQVCIRRQVNLWLLFLFTFIITMRGRSIRIHSLESVRLHQNVVRLTPLEFADARAHGVMRPSFLILVTASGVNHLLGAVVASQHMAIFLLRALATEPSISLTLRMLLPGELVIHGEFLRIEPVDLQGFVPHGRFAEIGSVLRHR